MEHTPGPWRADIRVGCVAVYPGEKVNCIEDSQGKRLYFANGHAVTDEKGNFDHWEVEPEKVANAHLIAAAPDMYEALKKLTGLLDSEDPIEIGCYCTDTGTGAPLICAWCGAKAALAKAEGRPTE